MDFTLTDEQQAIADLAHRILSEQLPPERLRELEQTDTWFADDVWAELGKADLLGIALPEADGGGGFGILEACLIAEQVGRTVGAGAVPEQHRGVGDADRRVRQRGAAQAAAPRRHRRRRHAHPRALRAGRRRGARRPHHPGHPRRRRLAARRREVARGRRRPGRRHPRPRPHRGVRVGGVPRAPGADGVHLTREVAVSGEPQWTVRLDAVARRRRRPPR